MFAKIEKFKPNEKQLAFYAKVLSYPGRVAIIKYLANHKVCIVGDIAEQFNFLSRTTVSQHLQELKKAGLIKGEIEGARINYCLNFSVINEIKSYFSDFFENIEYNYYEC